MLLQRKPIFEAAHGFLINGIINPAGVVFLFWQTISNAAIVSLSSFHVSELFAQIADSR